MTFLDYERIVREGVYFDWPVIADALGWQDLCSSWQMEYSERVYSLDINPESSQFLAGKFPNVEYVVGDSKLTLPPILAELQETQSGPMFVLIDGDHAASAVLADTTSVLAFRPRFPMVVMGHDSFNPDCRAGLLQAEWTNNPHVHYVEIDFVHGSILNRGVPRMQMWNGLFLALLLPQTRAGTLLVSQRHKLLFEVALQVSAHRPPSLARRFVRRFPLAQRLVRKLRRVFAGNSA